MLIQNNNNLDTASNINVVGFNTNGAKRNLNFIQYLCKYDLIFLSETWLLEADSINFLSNLSVKHFVVHKSDMIIYPIRGRPFGGRAFILSKSAKIIKVDFVNQYIATLSFIIYNKLITCIGCYFPYDNGSALNLSEFSSCLQVAYELLLFFESMQHFVILIGDFNADLLRQKRFDEVLRLFIMNNNLKVLSPSYNASNYSYSKGSYNAKLDHCLTSNWNHNNYIFKSMYIDNDINMSDHKPIFVNIEWKLSNEINIIDVNKLENDKIITIPPNFDNSEIREKFNCILNENMNIHVNTPIENIDNKQQIVDQMYLQLCGAIKLANDACSRTSTINMLKKNKNWFTYDLKVIKNNMIIIRTKENITTKDFIELKRLKCLFKKQMKKNIFLYEKNAYFKITKLIKLNNGEKFFQKVNSVLMKRNVVDVKIEDLFNHYSNIFNDPLKINDEIITLINNDIADLSHNNFKSINISSDELKYAMNKMLRSNVIGNDYISNNMILSINDNFIRSKVLFFFKFIFHFFHRIIATITRRS